ncbi:MAG: flagellar type III secretion system pore protein FliP [Planctomycetota bacterium]|nr:flagellar type III secretion system pore protein FliP [Planctomycetota bacterium]
MSAAARVSFFALLAALALLASAARAQFVGPPVQPADVIGAVPSPAPVASPTLPELPQPFVAPIEDLNPLSILETASRVLPGGGARTGAPTDPSVPGPGISSAVSIMIVLTVIGLVPTVMLMTTCFVRIIIVLGLLKQALGTQTIPPPQVILALSLFMSMLVMAPTVDRINAEAIAPYRAGQIQSVDELWAKARQPMRDFMFAQIEATGNWSTLYMLLDKRGVDVSEPEKLTRADVDMVTLIPAFMLSELKTAFLMGFRVYLPFLVIDMVISALLIAMSMMMLPPVLISLPFKLLLFVLVDGWSLVVGSLISSFAAPTPEAVAFAQPSVVGPLYQFIAQAFA